ncbi:MAG: NAD-dependent epimerase/dehydratase family protein [Candidatus Eisenbacteria bacterium]|nr:NAD-dependent epimerase/dehydratase family protein [Candidatus Eisenbacteria bacterium]
MAPILVTGATGTIGTHLTALLNREGIEPRVLLRRPCPPEAWGDLRVRPVPGDLADRSEAGAERLQRAMEGARTVYHLAAPVRISGGDAAEQWETNRDGTARLYAAAARAGAALFLHVSTIGAVGASEDGEAVNEDSPWNLGAARNPYFDSKRAAEEYLLAPPGTPSPAGLPPRPAGPPVVVVNPSVVLGSRASVRKRARLLSRGEPPPLRAVERLPRWTVLLRLPLPAPPVTLNLVGAEDVARGILLASARGLPGRRYLLTGADVDWATALRLLRPWVRTAPPLPPIPRPLFSLFYRLFAPAALLAGRSPDRMRTRARLARYRWIYSSERARRELGWTAAPIEETLRAVLGPERARS